MKKEKAVAIRYNSERENAPRIIAKGQGAVAKKIKEMGEENHIPIVEDQHLIDGVDHVEIGEEIPLELYEVMAQILAFVYQMKDEAKKRDVYL